MISTFKRYMEIWRKHSIPSLLAMQFIPYVASLFAYFFSKVNIILVNHKRNYWTIIVLIYQMTREYLYPFLRQFIFIMECSMKMGTGYHANIYSVLLLASIQRADSEVRGLGEWKSVWYIENIFLMWQSRRALFTEWMKVRANIY